MFSYKRVEGMTHVEAMRWISRADILADQLVVGSFGNVALEGLRLGKAVCVYVMDDILTDIGEPIPIVNINRDNVRSELERLVCDEPYRASFAERGKDFVHSRLDLENILDEIESLYVDPLPRAGAATRSAMGGAAATDDIPQPAPEQAP